MTIVSHAKVGILDIDLCGPSVARMLAMENVEVRQSSAGFVVQQQSVPLSWLMHISWLPVSAQCNANLSVMSIAFLLDNTDSAVIWRGPKKNAMIKQFLTDVCWGPLDYLIVDTPPGTSDEHISVVECLKQYRNPDGAILVTTPQVSWYLIFDWVLCLTHWRHCRCAMFAEK